MATLAVVGLVLATGTPPAHAQFRMEFSTTSYCDRLQGQYLAAVRQAGGGPSGAALTQIDDLSRQLAAAQVAAQRNNCNGGFFFMGPRGSACPAINADIQRLSRQLSQLRMNSGMGGGFFGFYSPQQEAARLRDLLADSGCGAPTIGATRTLCVRLCDGYYFPINAQANSTRFQTDAIACQSMYANGGEAELFVQPAGAEIEDATSVATGRRYGDLANALLYRDQYVPACAIQLKTGITALVSRYLALLPKKKATPVTAALRKAAPLPQLRTSASEDPETLANAAGSFKIAPVENEATPLVADAGAKSVRMVGASYYADLFDLAKVRHDQEMRPSMGLVGSAAAAEAPAAPPKGEAHAQ